MKKSSTIGARESDENQRNWTKRQLHLQNMKPRNFYDPTRQDLNFEINASGKVLPINTSPSITKRLEARCQQLGSKPPKKDAKMPRVRVLKLIVSGDTEIMRRLAFGEQDVDYSWNEEKTTNKGLVREKEIEQWAKDVHGFLCRKFGKENVVGFDCHLDENSPHIHAAIVPVGPDGKVSYSGLVGDKKWKAAAYFSQLHTELAEQVSSKWGMERGEDTSGRDVHHVEKAEYYAGLSRSIRSAETKAKSLRTMIANLVGRKEELERQMKALEDEIAGGKDDKKEMEAALSRLRDQHTHLLEKIEDKQKKLLEANRQLAGLKDKNESIGIGIENGERILDQLVKETMNDASLMARGAMFDAFYDSIKQLLSDPGKLKAVLGDNSVLEGLDDKGIHEIVHNAMDAFGVIITGGKPVSVGTGGGGSSNDDDWWKKKPEETYAALMKRCIFHSMRSYKTAYVRKTGRPR